MIHWASSFHRVPTNARGKGRSSLYADSTRSTQKVHGNVQLKWGNVLDWCWGVRQAVKDTRLDGGQFDTGQVLDEQSDAHCDDRDVNSDEESHEPNDQRHTPGRLSYTVYTQN